VSVCGCVYVGVCMCVCVSYLARSGLSTRKGVCVCVCMPVCHVWQQYGKGIGTRKGLLPLVLRDKTHGLINVIKKITCTRTTKRLSTHSQGATYVGCSSSNDKDTTHPYVCSFIRVLHTYG